MTQIYLYNGQPVAEGERTYVLEGGRTFVRTGLLAVDTVAGTITYRLRETVEVAALTTPDVTLAFEVPAP